MTNWRRRQHYCCITTAIGPPIRYWSSLLLRIRRELWPKRLQKGLLDRDHPVILGEMVRHLQDFIQAFRSENGEPVFYAFSTVQPAALYLLAYGGPEEWALVRSAPAMLQKTLLIDAAALSFDPRDLMNDTATAIAASDYLAYSFAEDAALFARFCPATRALHPEDRAYLDEYRHSLWQAVGISANISGKLEGSDRLTASAVLSMQESYCRASQHASKVLLEARDNDYLGPVTWFAHPFFSQNVAPVERWLGREEFQVEQHGHEEVAQLLQREDMVLGDATEVFLTAHRLVDRSQLTGRSPYDLGRDRRAFALRNEDEAKLVSGVVTLLPFKRADGFGFEISIEAAGYFQATLIDGPGSGRFEAIENGTSGLIADVELIQNGAPVVLLEQSSENGDVAIFSAATPNLWDSYLFVTLGFGASQQVLAFDVFSHPALRNASIGVRR